MRSDESSPGSEVSERQVDAVMRAARALMAVVAASLAPVEARLTVPQVRMLVLVATRADLTLNQMAEVVGVHPSNVTRAVDGLVEAGLVQRVPSRTDRRQVALTLTGPGRDLVTSVDRARRQAIAAVLLRMSARDRQRLAPALEAFATAAGEPAAGVAAARWAL